MPCRIAKDRQLNNFPFFLWDGPIPPAQKGRAESAHPTTVMKSGFYLILIPKLHDLSQYNNLFLFLILLVPLWNRRPACEFLRFIKKNLTQHRK
ncbi:hypothetical protein Osc7112_0654 [Oscillatoria nigro-viridis PCC 7112]|uniref:Uncharacterized protein n=1 Tax=Phormidium nigroviride PCC 7112 TaxID=179408 RepID=K9VDC0_9CYAN|nr:hypothetical protein Osc7112_0654 [Oscillatoria nigro-viridis PCC 7112]